MPHRLDTHFLPELTTPEELAGGTVVVIDVLRASTTITYALAAGAREVIPCLEIDEARQVAAKFSREQVVLGGERGGLKINGFDLGNSPAEYTAKRVGGKTVVFTTTNGTKAMRLCRQAGRVLIGAFVNLAAVCRSLEDERQVHLLCAGTDRRVSQEDVLAAGAIAARLSISRSHRIPGNDQAAIAMAATLHAGDHTAGGVLGFGAGSLAGILHFTEGGRNLVAVGLAKDLRPAAQIDRFDCVPELDIATWSIRLAGA